MSKRGIRYCVYCKEEGKKIQAEYKQFAPRNRYGEYEYVGLVCDDCATTDDGAYYEDRPCILFHTNE